MAAKRPRKGQKKRVEFRQNRGQTRRSDEWTKRFLADSEQLEDTDLSQSVRAKGELSRKRTIIVGDDDAPAIDEKQWRRGLVVIVHGRICRVEDEQGALWECSVRRVLRTLLTEQRSSVTVGDRVWFSDHSRLHDGQSAGVIERVEPRTSSLSRRDPRGRQHTLVANADQLLIVASVAQPRLKPHLIDRYLVAAGKGDLRPVICFNKFDLLDAAPAAATVENLEGEEDTSGLSVQSVLDEFRSLGYRCLCTSAATGQGLDELRAELAGHITVLSGQSGVGKSSLINALQPGLNLTVANVSAENEKGRHTTTLARLVRLDFGAHLVDTPGIRQFDLWNVEPGELEAFFVEFVPLVPDCQFRDCHHSGEAGCAVVSAVEQGRISARRYFSYLKMLEERARGDR